MHPEIAKLSSTITQKAGPITSLSSKANCRFTGMALAGKLEVSYLPALME